MALPIDFVAQGQLAEQHPTGVEVYCRMWLCPLTLPEPQLAEQHPTRIVPYQNQLAEQHPTRIVPHQNQLAEQHPTGERGIPLILVTL